MWSFSIYTYVRSKVRGKTLIQNIIRIMASISAQSFISGLIFPVTNAHASNNVLMVDDNNTLLLTGTVATEKYLQN